MKEFFTHLILSTCSRSSPGAIVWLERFDHARELEIATPVKAASMALTGALSAGLGVKIIYM
jgi:hypothetical protein